MKFSDLLGKTCTSVVNKDNAELIFTLDNGEVHKLYHYQDCCELVEITEIHGDLNDLVGEPLTEVEESISENTENKNSYTSITWTFYKLGTKKGHVTVRWQGESNGYYSERVDFE